MKQLTPSLPLWTHMLSLNHSIHCQRLECNDWQWHQYQHMLSCRPCKDRMLLQWLQCLFQLISHWNMVDNLLWTTCLLQRDKCRLDILGMTSLLWCLEKCLLGTSGNFLRCFHIYQDRWKRTRRNIGVSFLRGK